MKTYEIAVLITVEAENEAAAQADVEAAIEHMFEVSNDDGTLRSWNIGTPLQVGEDQE